MEDNKTFREIVEDREEGKIVSPIYFTKHKEATSPIYTVSDAIDGPDRFVIARTTDNGKWVRNGMIFYRLNGITIFADIDDIILVDLQNQTMTIRRGKNVKDMVTPEDPEYRQYLLLMYLSDSNTSWETIIGRNATYEYIKNNIEEFDPDQSLVLTENVPYKDAYSVTQFVKYVRNANLVDEDDFEIEAYSLEELSHAREQ